MGILSVTETLLCQLSLRFRRHFEGISLRRYPNQCILQKKWMKKNHSKSSVMWPRKPIEDKTSTVHSVNSPCPGKKKKHNLKWLIQIYRKLLFRLSHVFDTLLWNYDPVHRLHIICIHIFAYNIHRHICLFASLFTAEGICLFGFRFI